MPKEEKKPSKKERAKKYDPKLHINASFTDAIKVLVGKADEVKNKLKTNKK